MKNPKRLAILLATYNGQEYLKEQIDSLLNQTYKDFTIYISDDSSKDKTPELIKDYQKEYPDTIISIENTEKFGSAKGNFLNMVKKVESELYIFSDQDDVWLPNKFQELVNRYDQENTKDLPVVVYSDSKVVDSDLNVMYESFVKYMEFKASKKNLKFRLLRNDVAGCTMLFNSVLAQAYKNVADQIDESAIMMHDYFFVQIAAIFGNVYFVDKALMLYRQHGNNSVGISGYKEITDNRTPEMANVDETNLQVKEVLKIKLPIQAKRQKIVNKFLTLQKKGSVGRQAFFVLNNYHFFSGFRNISVLVNLFPRDNWFRKILRGTKNLVTGQKRVD
ncbi:MAG: glycosyltransferase family 2 protein [Treponema sp.]|nr:glycosyltransferase family 2 protein [Treponema sp.]